MSSMRGLRDIAAKTEIPPRRRKYKKRYVEERKMKYMKEFDQVPLSY